MSDINLIISATDNASKSLNQINNKLSAVEANANKMTGMGKAMGRAFIGAAAAFATIGVVSKVKDTIDNMDELAKRARNVGATSELAFGQFQVASKLLEEGGLSIGEADRAFRNLNTRIEKGLGGNKAYAEAMKGLGDSIFDANGKLKSTPELFAAVAQGVQNGSVSIEDAQKLLGEVVGPKIFNLFDDMKDRGITASEAFKDVAENIALVDLKKAQDAEAFNDALGRLGAGFNQLLIDGIGPLLPAMTEFIQDILAKMPEFVEKGREVLDRLSPAFSLIGTILTEAVLPILDLFITTIGYVAEAITPLVEGALPLIVSLFEKTQERTKQVVDTLAPLGEKILPYVYEGFDLLFGIVEKVIAKMQEIYQQIIPAVTAAFDTVMVKIDEIKAGVEQFVQKFTEMKEKVTGKAREIKEGVGNALEGMAEGATNAAQSAYDGVTGLFDDMADYLYENSVVPDMRDAIIASFEEMSAGMIAATETGTTGVSKKFDELETDLRSKTANINKFAANMTGLGFDLTGLTVDQADEFIGQLDELALNISDSRKATEFQKRALNGLTGSFKAGNISVKEYVGALEYLGVEQDNFTSRAARSAVSIGEQFMAMSSSIAGSMTDVIMGTKSGFDALKDIVGNTVKMIMQTLIQNFVVNPLMRNIASMFSGGAGGGGLLGGLMGGGGSILGLGMSTFLPGFGLLAGIGGILGGLFADGGNTARAGQKPILVGERGPEVFLPGRAGTVIANEELNAMQGQGDLNVNFTINAIDTQSGVEFLIENKRVITGVIQEAYQRRGTSGPLG